jgi:hypothetical protein
MRLPGLRLIRFLLLAPLGGFLPLLAQGEVHLINMSALEFSLVRVYPPPDGESDPPAGLEPTLAPRQVRLFTLPDGPADLEVEYLLEEVLENGMVEGLGQLVHKRPFERDDDSSELIFTPKAGSRSLELRHRFDGVHHSYGIYESMPPLAGIHIAQAAPKAVPESASAPFGPDTAVPPAETAGVHIHPLAGRVGRGNRRAHRGGRPINEGKPRPYQCPACAATFILWQDLRRHWYGGSETPRRHSPEELERVGVPGQKQVFKRQDQAKYLNQPLPVAAKKPAPSSLGPESGRKAPDLGAGGAAADTTPDPPLPYGCEVGRCNESFPNLKTLQRHWWGGKGGVGAAHTEEELSQAGLPTERPEWGTAYSLLRPKPAGGDSAAAAAGAQTAKIAACGKKVRRTLGVGAAFATEQGVQAYGQMARVECPGLGADRENEEPQGLAMWQSEAASSIGSLFDELSEEFWNPPSFSSPGRRLPLQTLSPQRHNQPTAFSPLASPGHSLFEPPVSLDLENLFSDAASLDLPVAPLVLDETAAYLPLMAGDGNHPRIS